VDKHYKRNKTEPRKTKQATTNMKMHRCMRLIEQNISRDDDAHHPHEGFQGREIRADGQESINRENVWGRKRDKHERPVSTREKEDAKRMVVR